MEIIFIGALLGGYYRITKTYQFSIDWLVLLLF